MADRVVWALQVGDTTVAHARWIVARELAVDAPRPLLRLIDTWFRDHTASAERDRIDTEAVSEFFEGALSDNPLGLVARPLAPPDVPRAANWLLSIDGDRVPPLGVRDPFGWGSNRFAPGIDLDWLLQETERGVVRWTAGAHSGFKAGGRCPDASEMWLNLSRGKGEFVLAWQHRRRWWEPPIRQGGSWFRKGQLQKIHRWLRVR